MLFKKNKTLALVACSAVMAASLVGLGFSLSTTFASADTIDSEGITLSAESLTLALGEYEDITVTLPDGVEAASYVWTSTYENVATPDVNNDETGTITAWAFGSTTITVTVTDTEDNVYTASADVLVTAKYFYLTGVQDDWSTYTDEADAKEAGVIFEEESTGVYTITTTLWANDGFQILHYGMDEAWTTKITPYWYDAENSSDNYVANSGDLFAVTNYGKYTVTLDLTQGEAKVSIKMDSLNVTDINFSVEGNGVLQEKFDEVVILIELLPEESLKNYDSSMLQIAVSDSANDNSYYSYVLDAENRKVTFTLDEEVDNEMTIYLTVTYGEASNYTAIPIASSSTALVTDIAFDSASYDINVNNGGEEWAVTVNATVNATATVQDVLYSTTDSGITVDAETGKVVASQFGVFTVTATAVGDPTQTDVTTIYVYSSQYYLIGILKGETVEDWIALDVTTTAAEFAESDFYAWRLTVVEDTNNTQYVTEEVTLYAGDLFTIAFLGMPGSWYGNINSAYLSGSNDTYYSINGTNVQINTTGKYVISLDLSGTVPSFTVEYKGEAQAETQTYYLYVVRAGDSWLSNTNEEGNILGDTENLYVATLTVNEDGTFTAEFTFDFYGIEPWPTFQFVIATGILNGSFINATWFGAGYSGIAFSGDAYSDSGESGTFSNYGAQMWWNGNQTEEGMTVDITVTFDADYNITAINLEPVTTTTDSDAE